MLTGGSGFIGRYLATAFSDAGWTVHIAFRDQSNLWRYEDCSDKQIIFVNIPFDNQEDWAAYLRKFNISTVIHLATYGSYPNQQDPLLTVETNVTGSLKFLNACISSNTVTRFVSAGSCSEYSQSNGHSNESSPIYSPNIYGATKAAFGILGVKLCEYTKIRFVHFRLFSIYGPYEDPKRIIPRIISYSKIKKLPTLSDPRASRDFVYIADVFNLFKIAIEGKSGVTGIYNLSSGINTNLDTLVDTARKIFNLNSLPIWGQYETRLFDSEKWSGENLAIKKDFGWIVQTDLPQGLQMFSSWVDNTLLNKYYKV